MSPISLKPDDSHTPSEEVVALEAQMSEPLPIAQPVASSHGEQFDAEATLLADSNFQALDPRFVGAERTAGWIFVACVVIAACAGLAIYWSLDWPPSVVSMIVAAGLGILVLFFAWAAHVYPALAYRHAAWRLGEQGLDIRRGVWWKHEMTVPRARVQHTDVNQGPLMRKFGLARLVIHTAGTQEASVSLDGLALDTAQRLRNQLVQECVTHAAAQEMR